MLATVVICRNPFNPAHNREVVALRRRRRIKNLAPKTMLPFICLVNGQPLLRAEWTRTVEDGDVVAFVTLPQGGGRGKSIVNTILTIVLVYYGGEAGAWAAGKLGFAAGTTGAAIGTGLGMAAGGALANAVIGPPQPLAAQMQNAMAAPSPTYTLGAQGNSARLGAAIPVQYGRHIAYPDFAADPYVEFAGNEQYLFQLLLLGQGSFDIEELRIEDTPMSSFDDITYEVVGPGGTVTLFPVNVITSIEVGGQEALTSTPLGPFVANAAGTVANYIGIDFVCPKGLYYANDAGTLTAKTVGFTVEARLIDDNGDPLGGWDELTTEMSNPVAATLGVEPHYSDLENRTYYIKIVALDAAGVPTAAGAESSITLTGGAYGDNGWDGDRIACTWPAITGAAGYQVWIGTATGAQDRYYVSQSNEFWITNLWPARPGAISTENKTGGTYTAATNTPQRFSLRYEVAAGRYEVRLTRTDTKDTSARAGHDLHWAGLRAYLPGDQQYGNVTLIAMRMKASNNLSQLASRRVNAICTRKIPGWNPTTGWSAAAASRSIAWAFADACRADYGGKLADAQIPLAQLYALDAIWTARGDTFDGRFDTSSTLWEALTQIARAGRAKCYQQGGAVQIVRDQAQSVPVALFSPRNTARGSLKVDYLMPTAETADAVEVAYFDESTWKTDNVTAKLAGSSGANPVKVQLFGCTNRDQAWREGMYMAACNRYRRKMIALSTEMEGFIPTFGDMVAISSDRLTRAQAGEVTGWNAGTRTLTLSEPLTWTAGQNHYFGLRRRNGGFSGPWLATAGADEYQAVLDSAPDITPYTGNMEERTHFTFGIGTAYRQLAIVTAARPRGMHQVELTLVNEDALVHQADGGTVPALPEAWQLVKVPTVPAVSGLNVVQGGTPDKPVLAISWQSAAGADHYLVEQSADGVAWSGAGAPTSTSLSIPVTAGPIQIRVAGIGITRGAWATWSGTAGAVVAMPSDVTGLALAEAFTGPVCNIKWDAAARATGYTVEVWAASTLRRTRNVTITQFSYSAADAKADGGPWRDLTFKVRATGTGTTSAGWAELAANKTQIGLLDNIAVTGFLASLMVEYQRPAASDFAGVRVYVSTTNGFTPGVGNLKYEGPDNVINIDLNPGSATYYLRIAGYDQWGTDGLTMSAQYSAATTLILSTQITDAAISTPKLAANAVTADKIAANTITANKLVAGTITAASGVVGDLNANVINAGELRGVTVSAASHTTNGSTLTSALSGGETTVYVNNTADFPSSGSAMFVDSTNDEDVFSYTGKTSTTLTGCSGVLAHNSGCLVIPSGVTGSSIETMLMNKAQNELRSYRDGFLAASIGNIAATKDSYRSSAWFGSVFGAITSGVLHGVVGSGGGYSVGGSDFGGHGVIGMSAYKSAVYGTSTESYGGEFLGNATKGNLSLPQLTAKPSSVATDQLAILNCSGTGNVPRLCFTDGTNWRKVSDNSIVT